MAMRDPLGKAPNKSVPDWSATRHDQPRHTMLAAFLNYACACIEGGAFKFRQRFGWLTACAAQRVAVCALCLGGFALPRAGIAIGFPYRRVGHDRETAREIVARLAP